jgi:dTDP-4-dehydrorhamnose 3,5-epimerase
MSGHQVKRTDLEGVLLFAPPRHADERGQLTELYRRDTYAELGLPDPIVQVNASRSRRGVLRGLHYQLRRPQGKLVFALRGEIFDVAVDIRRGSPTFGRWFGAVLSEHGGTQMFVPGWCAHAFCVLSDEADVVYGLTDVHEPGDGRGVLWSDPDIGISWPFDDPILSPKDADQPRLLELGPDDLPPYAG